MCLEIAKKKSTVIPLGKNQKLLNWWNNNFIHSAQIWCVIIDLHELAKKELMLIKNNDEANSVVEKYLASLEKAKQKYISQSSENNWHIEQCH